MIKSCLKNFFVNLKFIFTPLGVMFLGALSGFAVLVSSVTSAVTELADCVTKLLSSTTLDGSALLESIASAVIALDWSDLSSVLAAVTDREWLSSVLGGGVRALIVDYDAHVAEITECVTSAVNVVVGGVVGFFLLTLLGFAAGYAITSMFIRRESVSGSVWKTILSAAFGAVIATLLLMALTALSELVGAWWAFAIIVVLGSAITLAEAYLLHGVKRVKFTSVFNPRNIVGLLVSHLAIIAITALLIVLVEFAFGALCGLFTGLSLLTVAAIVMNVNAEAYVSGLAGKAKPQPVDVPSPEKEKTENEQD